MNYGLYLSASGVLTNSYRQDVFANNLANVNTVAFKPDMPTLTQRLPEAAEGLTPLGTANDLLDRLGGGVLAGPQRTSFAAGAIEQTGRDLDVAFTDRSSFFAVEQTDPNTGNATVRLTRDGRFAINAQGYLVTTAGHRLLGQGDRPIQVNANAKTSITADGGVRQNGAEVARLQVATVNDTSALEKAGGNLFAFTGNDPRSQTDNPNLRIGALESSGTNAIGTMMQIMAAAKAATANAKLIKYHDSMMDKAINTLGRVA